jgi:hypothetical protein
MNIHSCSLYCLEYNCVVEQRDALRDEVLALRMGSDRLQKLLTMCAELVREEANTHDDDCDCDYCEAVAELEQKP